MCGCRFDAKNTPDKNYLYLAEKRGAKVHAETKVVDIRPLGGVADGSLGYEVVSEPTWGGGERRTWRARKLIVAASSLGTQSPLFKLKTEGSLPNVSDDLGNRVRTNAESILRVRYPERLEPPIGWHFRGARIMPFVQPTNVDGLALLSVRHGIVVDSGSLVPRHDDVGGYLLATSGYLHTYPGGDREVQVVAANLREAFAQRQPRTLTADIAGITADDLIRRSARRGDEESA